MKNGRSDIDLAFKEEIIHLLESKGVEFTENGHCISFPSHNLKMTLVPLKANPEMLPTSHPTCQWEQQYPEESNVGEGMSAENAGGSGTVFLFEDRWRKSPGITSQRILARLGVFTRVHARLCKTVSEENCRELGMSPAEFTQKVRKFLDTYHTYGFLKGQINYALVYKENIVAAAQFMQTYKPRNGSSDLRAYEWTRYASLPDMRIAGGMGKVLEQFVRDVRSKQSNEGSVIEGIEEGYKKKRHEEAGKMHGFEVMSYSDNEWSDGDAYRKLGFRLEGSMPPVTYRIDPKTFNRINPRQWAALKTQAVQSNSQTAPSSKDASLTLDNLNNYPVIRNLGSRKWIKLYR